MSRPDLNELITLVRQTARAELIPRFTHVSYGFKTDGSVVTEADLSMQQRLITELAARWPEIRLLGEEMNEVEQLRLLQDTEQPLWCLDPVDGTSNFAAGIPYFSVSLALIRQGEVQLGLVYDPIRDECFSAIRGQGAWLNQQRLEVQPSQLALSQAIALVDFKRLPKDLATELIKRTPYSSQRNFGSSALDWCWIASGRGHVYLHGRQNIWDYGAGALILSEAGGQSTTLAGEPVFCASMTPRSVVAALTPALFCAWQDWIKSVT